MLFSRARGTPGRYGDFDLSDVIDLSARGRTVSGDQALNVVISFFLTVMGSHVITHEIASVGA